MGHPAPGVFYATHVPKESTRPTSCAAWAPIDLRFAYLWITRYFARMSILGHGIDLVECSRIARVWENHKDRFLRRILTSAEQERAGRYRHPLQFIAGRWAAKEAILKMIGTGWQGRISWRDMEILPDELGRPTVKLTGETARVASKMGIEHVQLSITHTEHYAAASAIGLSGV